MRYLYWTVTLIIGAAVTVFALANWRDVPFALSPFTEAEPVPLAAVALGAMLVGFIIGEVTGWLSGGRWRREARVRGRRIEALQRELAATQAKLGDGPAVPRVPALRSPD